MSAIPISSIKVAALGARPCRHHHAFAWQMLGEGFARGPTPLESLDLGRAPCRRLGREVIFGGARGELVELELQLPEKALGALRALPVECAAQLLDHQRQGGDLCLRIRDLGLGRRGPRLRIGQSRLQRPDLNSGAVHGHHRSVGGGATVHGPQSKAKRLTP